MAICRCLLCASEGVFLFSQLAVPTVVVSAGFRLDIVQQRCPVCSPDATFLQWELLNAFCDTSPLMCRIFDIFNKGLCFGMFRSLLDVHKGKLEVNVTL